MFLMWGYPGEQIEDIAATVDLVKRCLPDIHLTTVAYPIKNTGYFHKAAELVVSDKDWADSTDRDYRIKGPPFPQLLQTGRFVAEQRGGGRPDRRCRIRRKRRCGGRPRCGRGSPCWQPRWKRRPDLPPGIPAFDAQAGTYDSRFTTTAIGAAMRRAVWARCAVRFAPGSRVLEMNCGTGEDALWLAQRGVRVLATDVSPGMLQVAQEKLAAAPGAALARFQRLAWEDLDTFDEGPFDGVLSNFGGLNCVADIAGAAGALAAKLRPGAAALLCVMGPVVPWEWLWFLSRADPARAFRRLRRAGTEWSGITVRYPSIARMRRAFGPQFRVLRISAIGSLLPPPYTEKWTGRFPRAIAALDRMERRVETLWPLPALADHYLMELERR